MERNVENINKVIVMIENEANHFDMGSWDTVRGYYKYPENVCGTPSCIGGWAEAIMRVEQNLDKDWHIPVPKIREWLGINYYESHDLFFNYEAFDVSRDKAVAHLRAVAAGEPVDWRKYL